MEQPLPPYGSCNLGSLDLNKFTRENGSFDWELFEIATRMSVRFLDSVIDVNSFPTKEIEENSRKYRQIGLGIMGFADMCMKKEVAYGSEDANVILDEIGEFIYDKAKEESEKLGQEKGVPEYCRTLPNPRRNMTLLTVAPTGTISILAGCNNGIEPFFSEITQRKDNTGEYVLDLDGSSLPHFRCAVPKDGEKWKEVTWREHVLTQTTIQKHVDSGVSKTINFPTMTHKDTIGKAFMLAWKEGAKGITVYRNGSRDIEVLSPKNVSKNLCPMCESTTIKYDGCTKCSECDWSLCTV